MELFEALVISFINTVIVSTLCGIKVKTRRKVEVHGPFLYKLDNSGTLKVTAESIPKELSETLRQKILNEIIRPPNKTMQRLHIIIFALIIFTIQLTVLLLAQC
ncbi:MAG: hypothetical protein QMD23_07255 [Candidatus Bathyarchaeia archaeon]|nr:hypothetical protein [Candidatus Bathyarchaeia archaeon]